MSRIAEAAAAAEAATARLREVVVEAATRPDANITAIAAEAGVGRQTVYRWLRQAGHDGVLRNPAGALDDALSVLVELGAGPLPELLAGLRTRDASAKARRVRLGMDNLPRTQISEEQRAILAVGHEAARHVLGGARDGAR